MARWKTSLFKRSIMKIHNFSNWETLKADLTERTQSLPKKLFFIFGIHYLIDILPIWNSLFPAFIILAKIYLFITNNECIVCLNRSTCIIDRVWRIQYSPFWKFDNRDANPMLDQENQPSIKYQVFFNTKWFICVFSIINVFHKLPSEKSFSK